MVRVRERRSWLQRASKRASAAENPASSSRRHSVAEQAEDEYPCLVLSKYLYYIESSEGDVTHYLSDLDCIILSNYQERIGGAEGGEGRHPRAARHMGG